MSAREEGRAVELGGVSLSFESPFSEVWAEALWLV